MLEVWVDPKLDRNVHRIEVVSDSAIMEMTIENFPTDNPKTVKIILLIHESHPAMSVRYGMGWVRAAL